MLIVSPARKANYGCDHIRQNPRLNLLGFSGLICAFFLMGSQVHADFISDDFCDGTLGPAWTYIDPLTDGTLTFSGASTADAWLKLSVPAGREHQVWTNGIKAPHVIQAADNTDFELEVKFESAVNAPQYQEQGVVIKQDDFNFLRFEIFSDNSNTIGFSAALHSTNSSYPLSNSIFGNELVSPLNTAPIYMRVKRAGNVWTHSYSTDGTSFTNIGTLFNHSLTVTGVGIYGGNAVGSSSPAHTARFDYLENLASPIANEDACGLGIHAVTYDGNGNDGGTAPVDGNSPYNNNATVTVLGAGDLSLSGHSLAGWNTQADGLGISYAQGATFMIAANTTLYAQWMIPAFASDDFCTGVRDPVWAFVNPSMDGTLTFAGAMTPNAWLELSVPAGMAHELWTSGIRAPHIIQAADNTNFELEVKFESPVNVPQFQEQGVVIKQDDFHFLRFEIYSAGSNTKGLSAALQSAGEFPLTSTFFSNEVIGPLNTAPIYMRVKREGDLWTQSYSLDGISFTNIGSPFSHILNVTGVGLYGGNAQDGSAPAHTAQFDYLENLADPITNEDACTPCNSTKALMQNDWQLVSLPCNPGATKTLTDIFGDDLGVGTYDQDWVVYRRNETAMPPAYVGVLTTDPLAIGESYWIKTTQTGQSVDITGTNNTLTDIPLTGVLAAPPEGCGNSAGQCNMVGHPHDFDVCWADVKVVDVGGAELTLAMADPGGVCQTTGDGCIMSSTAHKWTGFNYATFDGDTPGMGGTLKSWDGLWVSANKPGIKLRIPATTSSCGAPTEPMARAVRSARSARAPGGNGWFIRLIAESGNMRDETNVFGQLPDSVHGYDSHDLLELEPFGTPYLTVVFPHENWGLNSGAYASDYRELGSTRRGEIWHFEVRASDPELLVTLSWEGSEGKGRFRNATLIDLETGHNVTVGPGGSYTFKMGAESHRFRWIQNRGG